MSTTSSQSTQSVDALARLVRHHIVRATTAAGSGHPTSSASAVELMVGLFFGEFRADLKNPEHAANDRLIFSKGHAAPLLYALYCAAGVITQSELLELRKLASQLEGHPTPQFPYTEAATGSLGQGLSVGLGEALALRQLKSPARVFVLLGDGELAEGSNWEAAALAAYYKTGNLIAVADINRLGQAGTTLHEHHLKTYEAKFKAFGWKTLTIDGHNFKQIAQAYKKFASANDRQPKIILAKTLKGKGLGLENKLSWHGKPLSSTDAEEVLQKLGPVDLELRGVVAAPESYKLEAKNSSPIAFTSYKPGDIIATRKAYGTGLVALGKADSRVVVLDGDVSNSTYSELFAQEFHDRFFEMFIAEQNMAGTALGMARRGQKPFASTFAAFWTRAFDQIRMAALSQVDVTFCGSHAGVSIGEDGASQMGLEDLAMFRTVFGSTVLYPSDAVATERLVAEALDRPGIKYIRTTRMATPVLYGQDEKFPIGGSKTVKSSPDDQVTLVGAGITLHEALKASETLKKAGITARVIDLYSVKPIDEETLKMAAKETRAIIVAEDHWFEGGLGDAVLNVFADSPCPVPIIKLAVTTMPHSGKPEELLAVAGIDAEAIVGAAKVVLKV